MIRVRAPLLAAVVLLHASSAFAVPVPGLFDTGVNAAGVVLGAGEVDPHYTLIASADPSFPGPSAVTADPIASGYWFANNAISRWIAPAMPQGYPGGGTPHPAGLYRYRLSFDLTGIDPGTVVVSGNACADNNGTIELNGASIGTGIGGYNPLSAFSIATGFVPGVNHLDFVVTNFAAGGSNPTGLRVQGLSGTGTQTLGIETGSSPRTLELLAPYPNPASGSARVGFALPQAGRVRLRVLDLSGRTVRTLADRDYPAGRHETAWDGLGEKGAPAGAGVYFLALEANGQWSSRRLAWIR